MIAADVERGGSAAAAAVGAQLAARRRRPVGVRRLRPGAAPGAVLPAAAVDAAGRNAAARHPTGGSGRAAAALGRRRQPVAPPAPQPLHFGPSNDSNNPSLT